MSDKTKNKFERTLRSKMNRLDKKAWRGSKGLAWVKRLGLVKPLDFYVNF